MKKFIIDKFLTEQSQYQLVDKRTLLKSKKRIYKIVFKSEFKNYFLYTNRAAIYVSETDNIKCTTLNDSFYLIKRHERMLVIYWMDGYKYIVIEDWNIPDMLFTYNTCESFEDLRYYYILPETRNWLESQLLLERM